jgi:hypothetical protein
VHQNHSIQLFTAVYVYKKKINLMSLQRVGRVLDSVGEVNLMITGIVIIAIRNSVLARPVRIT